MGTSNPKSWGGLKRHLLSKFRKIPSIVSKVTSGGQAHEGGIISLFFITLGDPGTHGVEAASVVILNLRYCSITVDYPVVFRTGCSIWISVICRLPKTTVFLCRHFIFFPAINFNFLFCMLFCMEWSQHPFTRQYGMYSSRSILSACKMLEHDC
jgi:hypothetical protein